MVEEIFSGLARLPGDQVLVIEPFADELARYARRPESLRGLKEIIEISNHSNRRGILFIRYHAQMAYLDIMERFSDPGIKARLGGFDADAERPVRHFLPVFRRWIGVTGRHVVQTASGSSLEVRVVAQEITEEILGDVSGQSTKASLNVAIIAKRAIKGAALITGVLFCFGSLLQPTA